MFFVARKKPRGCLGVLKSWHETRCGNTEWPQRRQPYDSPEFFRLDKDSTHTSCLHFATFRLSKPRVLFFCVDRRRVFYTGRCPGRINARLFFTAAPTVEKWLFGSDPATVSLSTLSDNNGVASSLVPFNFHRSSPHARLLMLSPGVFVWAIALMFSCKTSRKLNNRGEQIVLKYMRRVVICTLVSSARSLNTRVNRSTRLEKTWLTFFNAA